MQSESQKNKVNPAVGGPLSHPLIQRLIAKPEFIPFVLLVLLLIIFTIQSQGKFASVRNISNQTGFIPELGIIALGMTMLMTAGEFDLSVGSVFGFTPIVMWALYNEGVTSSLEIAFLISMAIAVLIGLINGWFVTRLKIPSFLVTLGMLLVVRGSALYITSGFPQRTWRAESRLTGIMAGEIIIPIGDEQLRIYTSLLWFILFAIILGYVLTMSKAGNWIQATGGNAVSAAARGVRVARTKVLLFVLTAVMSAYAGVTSSIRVSAANPNSGDGYELEVIAMVVIGGTMLTGGKGTILGTFIGVLILRMMSNGIIFIGIPGLAYKIFIGGIILGMMALHSWLARRNHTGG